MALTTDWQLIGENYVGNTGYGNVYLRSYAKYSVQEIANNRSYVYHQSRLYLSAGTFYAGATTTAGISSALGESYGNNKAGNYSAGETVLLSQEGWVGHDTYGNLNMSFGCSFYSSPWGWNTSVSASASLPTIPRGGVITSFSVVPYDETTLRVDWSFNTNADWIQYSLNGGDWVNTTGTTFYISNLTSNTTYNVRINVRRTDTQVWTQSGTLSATTYAYPHITNYAKDPYVIGEEQTLTLYNPLKRTVQVSMLSMNSATAFYSGTTSGTSISFTPISSAMYNEIPNAKTGTVRYRIIYSNVSTRTTVRPFKINEEECKPIFENFTYQDTNTNVQTVVNNNQILVDRYSQCQFTISVQNKAVGKNGASIYSYTSLRGTGTPNSYEYKDNEDVVGTMGGNNQGSQISVTAWDTRDLSTTVTKTITSISYVDAVIDSLETKRNNGVEAKTFLAGKFRIWKGNWQGGDNANYDNRLKYVGYRVYDGSAWSNYFDVTTVFLNKASTSTTDGSLIYEVSLDDELEIHKNGSSGGFTIGDTFLIEVLIKDGTNSSVFTPPTYQATLQTTIDDGSVYQAVYKDSDGKYHMAFNEMPSDDYAVNVGGELNATEIFQNGIPIDVEKINRIGKLLWSGSFASGTITVEGISNYTMVAMVAGDVFCVGSPSWGGGLWGNYGYLSVDYMGYRFVYTKSNETLTINSTNQGARTSTGTVYPVTAIYGLF